MLVGYKCCELLRRCDEYVAVPATAIILTKINWRTTGAPAPGSVIRRGVDTEDQRQIIASETPVAGTGFPALLQNVVSETTLKVRLGQPSRQRLLVLNGFYPRETHVATLQMCGFEIILLFI